MKTYKYRILFAPDGVHFQHVKSGGCANMWDFFTHDPDIRIQIAVNLYAKFRLVHDDRIIGELPPRKEISNVPA